MEPADEGRPDDCAAGSGGAEEEVARAWRTIDTWMAWFAPLSAQAQHPAATTEAIAAAEEELGLKFPADVVRSLLVHNGQPRYCDAFPGYPLLPLEDIVKIRRQMVAAAEDDDDLGHGDSDDCWWHEKWLPVSELDGDLYVVDLRPGPGYGRLGWVPRDDEGGFDQNAPTFAGYLTQVAAALATGSEVDGEVPYVTERGALYWSYPGEETTDDGERIFRTSTG